MFDKVLRDIRAVKIQGAANVALAAIDAMKEFFSNKEFKSKKSFLKEVDKRANMLLSTRPNEPLMMNSLNYIKRGLSISEDVESMKGIMNDNVNTIKIIVEESRQNITSAGANRIRNNSKILLHCHSSSVVSLLKLAKQRGINFEVFNTETRPLYQGRKTAKELAKAGIKVNHFVDSAFGAVMPEIDYVIVGCDVINSEVSVVNKIGTYPISVVAKRENVPFYVVSSLLKFDPRTRYNIGFVEQRGLEEVWKKPPKGISILNPAFDVTPRSNINAFITEFGVVTPESVPETIKKKYPWVFD